MEKSLEGELTSEKEPLGSIVSLLEYRKEPGKPEGLLRGGKRNGYSSCKRPKPLVTSLLALVFPLTPCIQGFNSVFLPNFPVLKPFTWEISPGDSGESSVSTDTLDIDLRVLSLGSLRVVVRPRLRTIFPPPLTSISYLFAYIWQPEKAVETWSRGCCNN